MNRLTWQPPELEGALRIVEQSAPFKTSWRCSKSVLVSMPKCWSTDRPINNSSTARSASGTRVVTLTDASGPPARLWTVLGGVRVLGTVSDCALSASLGAIWSVNLSIFVIFSISSSAARSANLKKTIDLLLPSSAQPVAAMYSLLSATVTGKKETFSKTTGAARDQLPRLMVLFSLCQSWTQIMRLVGPESISKVRFELFPQQVL